MEKNKQITVFRHPDGCCLAYSGTLWGSGDTYEAAVNDLKTKEEQGTKDQSIETQQKEDK